MHSYTTYHLCLICVKVSTIFVSDPPAREKESSPPAESNLFSIIHPVIHLQKWYDKLAVPLPPKQSVKVRNTLLPLHPLIKYSPQQTITITKTTKQD